MTLSSMTGFAQEDGADDRVQWRWEARSVNGKGLDLRLRLPRGWERLDPLVRVAVQDRLKRGTISVSLDIRPIAGRSAVRINQPLLDDLIARCETFGDTPRLEALFAVHGVVESMDEDTSDLAENEDRIAAVTEGLEDVIARLAAARAEEGGRIAGVLRDHLGEIEALVEEAGQCGEASAEAIRDRLAAQLAELLRENSAPPPERLAQEVAVLAVKADVREELDRLRAHIGAARDLLREGVAIGRRLDFLCQEFNREANTLAAKASVLTLTRIGLNLKTVIDRLREQAQNLE